LVFLVRVIIFANLPCSSYIHSNKTTHQTRIGSESLSV
jgi:hypothetical protein